MAGGFVAPVLRAAGWELMLFGRDSAVATAIETRRGIWAHAGGNLPRWIDGVSAAVASDELLHEALATADLVITAVGPAQLTALGRALAGGLMRRHESGRLLNILTFENHRRAPELLADALLEAEPRLASAMGRSVGLGGAAVWRAIVRRQVAPDGVHYWADDVDDAYFDGMPLVDAPPRSRPIEGLMAVTGFDNRMVEKLWLFNGGHAAAAYLGWLVGCRTIAEAMSRPAISSLVRAVVEEAQRALDMRHRLRRQAPVGPERSTEWILGRFADQALVDPVTRVGREPRRKLAPGDRLLGPAITCAADGGLPAALPMAIAAAFAYEDPNDNEAVGVRREVQLLGVEEPLDLICGVQANEPLAKAIVREHHELVQNRVAAIDRLAGDLNLGRGFVPMRS